MKRAYPFPFPYETSLVQALAIASAIKHPEYAAMEAHLPEGVRAKLDKAGWRYQPSFDKADFDALPDDLWAKLAPHL